jgi:hypothetical protein
LAELHYLAGEALLAARLPELSRVILTRATELGPMLAAAWIELGDAKAREHENSDAPKKE